MAKGQKRSGREAKKPKQTKTKSDVAASPFTTARARGGTSSPGKGGSGAGAAPPKSAE